MGPLLRLGTSSFSYLFFFLFVFLPFFLSFCLFFSLYLLKSQMAWFLSPPSGGDQLALAMGGLGALEEQGGAGPRLLTSKPQHNGET